MSEELKNETEVVTAETKEETTVTEVEEKVEEIPSMDNFENEINESFKKIHTGDVVEGTVISVTDTEILINMGYISDGIIAAEETNVGKDEALTDLYKVGDRVKAEVLKKDDGQGNVLLSINKAYRELIWQELEEVSKEDTSFLVKVKDAVKGGVVCDLKGVRAFIPASLLSIRYVEDLKVYVGQEIRVKVAEFSKEDNKIILSRKAVEKQEFDRKKQEIFSTIKKGDRFTGTVKKLMNFGAFVDIGGVDGLVHISDLSWEKVKHPSDVVKEGDTVNVYVLKVDISNEKISLGLKDINEDPWTLGVEKIQVGNVYEGSVERVVDFGLFVKIIGGVEGLVHISQISEERVEDPSSLFAVGDTVKVAVQSIDVSKKKISLSIKAAKDKEDKNILAEYATDESATTSLKDVFGDIFDNLK